MSALICNNGDQIDAMPIDAFVKSPMSTYVDCATQIGSINLNIWQDCSCDSQMTCGHMNGGGKKMMKEEKDMDSDVIDRLQRDIEMLKMELKKLKEGR